jgi:aquaporin Z
MLYVIAQGKTGGYDMAANGFAQNGWSAYSMVSAFLFEMAGTFIFVMVILRAPRLMEPVPWLALRLA